MAESHELGKAGEKLAADLLKSKGYTILEQNWRNYHSEIDIIALFKDEIVFVEVKTRSSTFMAEPEFTVNRNKQRLLMNAASAYIKYKCYELDARFDIISIVFSKEVPNIEHLENAFYASL